MKNRLLPGLVILTIILLFAACSKKYVSPILNTVVEPKITDEEGVFFTSLPMTYSKEGRYSQKAQDKGLQFAQVAVSNRTQDTIQLTATHLQAFADYQSVQLIPQQKIYQQLKQKKGPYFLYLIPGLFITQRGVQYYPVLAPLGIYHFIRASLANKDFKEDFLQYSLLGQKLAPGASTQGWVCVDTEQPVDNLLIRYVD